MTRRNTAVVASLAFAASVAAWVLATQPRHGLVLQRFSDEAFQVPDGSPVIDKRVHFSSHDPYHPKPEWVRFHTSARWTGFLDVPREADYNLGVISDDGAKLYVDDALLVDNGGRHPRRNKDTTVRLTAGPHAVRIDYVQAEGDATLKFSWYRSGNNPTYEIVPISMLYPERPPPITTAARMLRFLPWLLVGLAAWLLRGRAFPAHAPRTAYAAAALIFLLALGVRLNGLLTEGETCDQWTYVSAGYVYAQNIAAGIIDPDQWAWNSEHPNIGKLIHGAVQFVFGPETWHVNAEAAVLGALAVLTIFWTGVRLGGLPLGVAAGLVLALIPSFVAHGRIAALDTPSTFFFTLAMSLLVRAVHDERDRRWTLGAMTLATGMAIGTKFSNVFLLPLEALSLGWLYWPAIRALRWREIPAILYAFPLLILVPTLATWPWMWTDPAGHWKATSSHWQYTPPDLFLGTVSAPPPQYFFVAFLSVVPILLFPFALLAMAQPFRRLPALFDRGWWLLLLGWFAIPFAWTLANFRMNGVRYILNVFPPFALLVAGGIVIAASRMPKFAPVLTAAVTAYLLIVDARIHPYYLDYFNEAVGGAKSVQERQWLDTGWWGEGIDPAARWVNEHAAPNATYDLQAWAPPGVPAFRADLRRTEHQADFIVRQKQPITAPPNYEQVFEVTAGGAHIVRVFQRH